METATTEKGFDPQAHLMKLKGKDYLPVAARVLWFREDYPIEGGWRIQTKLVDGGFKEGYALFQAVIVDPEGRVVASGHNVEDKQGFGDFLMKAETGAIGRALAAAGFGTMAALDEGEVVDAPVDRKSIQRPTPEEQPLGYPCEQCNADVDYQTAGVSRRKFSGKVFCVPCGRQILEGMKAGETKPLACQDCGQLITEKVANASMQGKGRFQCVDCARAEKAKEAAASAA